MRLLSFVTDITLAGKKYHLQTKRILLMLSGDKTRKNHKTGKGNNGRGKSSVKKGRGKILLRKGLKKLAKRLPYRYFKPLSPKDQKNSYNS